MAEAAEALFGRYATLGQDEHEEAVSVFARYERPYYDAPRGRWLVGSYPLARSILKDDRLGNDLSLAHIRTNSEQLRTRLSPDAPSLLFIDPPAHNLIKTELARLFSREALEELGDTLRERWHDALSGLHAGSQVKLGGAAVHPICVEAVFATLGLAQPAPDELPALVDDLYQVNLLFDLNASAEQRTCSQAANQRLRDLVIGLLPGSAVAERMSVAGASTGVIVSTTVFMLRAGVVTLGSLLMSTLAERLSPHGCPAGAMNLHSLLVRHTPTGDTGRVTTQNVSLGGVDLPARSTVLALISAANAGLVMEAASLAGHLVFGAGTHRCVGERLVRMQVEAAIDATSSCTRHVTPVSTEPHRTPSFRGFREIQVEVDGGTR
jgi:unspecific monooxygenase